MSKGHVQLRPLPLLLVLVGLAVVTLYAGGAWHGVLGAATLLVPTPAASPAACRPPLRGKVYVRYRVPTGGLCNQLNSHVNALSLALGMGADAVVFPYSVYRESFNHTRGGGTWKHASSTTLFDLDATRQELEAWGLEMHVAPLSDQEQVDTPWINCVAADPAMFEKPPGYKFLQANLATLVSKLREEFRKLWAQHGPSTCIVVDAGNAFGALRTNSTGNLTVVAAASLKFAPRLEELASRVAAKIGGPFNGGHLRLEPDMGLDVQAAMLEYMDVMRAVGFKADLPLYFASGLLTYGDRTTFNQVSQQLINASLCSRAVAKEILLPAAEFEGLNSEQSALIDLLVLTRSAALVGHRDSSFSLYVRDYRTIRGGGSRTSTRMVKGDGDCPGIPGPPEKCPLLGMAPAPERP